MVIFLKIIASCKIEFNFFLPKQERPVKLAFNKKVEVVSVLGQNVKLFCKFEGNPEPEVYWQKHEQNLLKKDSKYNIETLNKFAHSYLLFYSNKLQFNFKKKKVIPYSQ